MNRYNANVRIGNWYDELMLQEEKTKQYMRRSKNMELQVQKVRQLFQKILTEVPLTLSVSRIPFSKPIQIVASEAPSRLVYGLNEKQGIALAASIDFKNVQSRLDFAPNDPVIGTGLLTPCTLNVWTLIPEDPSLHGKEIRYGDSFRIKLHTSNPPLYIEAPSLTPSTPTGESGHVMPKLVASPSTVTRFKVLHIQPHQWYETEGSAVQRSDKVILAQAASLEFLAIEDETWFPTYFGMECEVSVHTIKDPKNPRKLNPKNFWNFNLTFT